jgi:ubiquinone/menaquinone biosynthesis C-methylase UbiE
MSSGAARRFFQAIAGRYEREYALPPHESRWRMERVQRNLPPPPSQVLDLGVGTGRELSALLDAGYEPTGVDLSEAMLERCARRARPVPLVHADFWAPLPFQDASFDAVIALHGTLAHPPGDASLGRLAQELARVVRPQGSLVVEVPAPAWLEQAATDSRVRRIGPHAATYQDPKSGAAIDLRVLSATAWVAVLAPAWVAYVEPLGEVEWLVVARRAR